MTNSNTNVREARSAEGLLQLLARAASALEVVGKQADLFGRDTDLDLEGIRSVVSSEEAAWESLRVWASAWPKPPLDEIEFRRWMVDTETLGKARKGLARLGIENHEVAALRLVLNELFEELESLVAARNDQALFAGDAERIGSGIAPWSWLRGGTVQGFLAVNPQASGKVCDLWIRERLHSEDDARLRAIVGSETWLRTALRDAIARECAEVAVMRWTPAWSIDVARTESELSYAAELLRLRTPHTGKQLLVRQHAHGTWWNHPDGNSVLVPFEVATHTWHDEVLGDFTTTIRVAEPDPAQDARHAIAGLHQITDGLKTPRNLEIVQAVVRSLDEGELGKALEDGHRGFEDGTDVNDLTEQLVRHALEARLLMSDVSMVLANEGVDIVGLNKALAQADAHHDVHDGAVQLIPDELYYDCVDGLPLDPHEWWGSRARVEEVIPRGLVDSLLVDLADTAARKPADARSLTQLEPDFQQGSIAARIALLDLSDSGEPVEAMPAVNVQRFANLDFDGVKPLTESDWRVARTKRTKTLGAGSRFAQVSLAAASKSKHAGDGRPCAWFKTGGTPAPGCVPLLLVDERAGRGIVSELRVTIDNRSNDEAVWSGAKELERLARDIVRDAYYATASAMPAGSAPPSFGKHRLELVLDPAEVDASIVAIDGRSIGLPVALAFASVWTGQAIASDVAAVGTVLRHQMIDAVGGVREKALALASLAGRAVRVITAPGNEAEIREAGLLPVSVEKLVSALEAGGIEPRATAGVSYGSVMDRENKLSELAKDIETGNRTRYGDQTRWEQLGDDLRGLIRSLENTQSSIKPTELARARCIAALAYSHAGFLNDAKDVLYRVDRPDHLRPDVRALFDIVQLGVVIDRNQLQDADGATAITAVVTDLDELRRADDREMLGRAAGTLGRAYLHLRDLDRALPLLREAVRHHAQHQRYETGRSRIYLSMALRMAGHLEEALDELLTGSAELETSTRDYSPQYEVATRSFLDYEMARVLVALERYAEAHHVATRALEACRWTAWPQLGILRIRAWASRMSGRIAEADADVEQMRVWAQAHDSIDKRLLEEAAGYPIEDGEVY